MPGINVIDVDFEMTVPIKVRAKAVVEAGQVQILDAYMVNDAGGTHVRNLGDAGYLMTLDRIAAEARDRDREDFDARR